MQMAQALIEDFKDGVGVRISFDAHAAKTLAMMLLKGKAGRLPLTIKIDPSIDSK